MRSADKPVLEQFDLATFRVPIDPPEADGTLVWDNTTVVTVTAHAAGLDGFGFTYGSAACATVITELLIPQLVGRDARNPPGAWEAMVRAIRNQGRPGIASMAIAAVDIALWDLAAQLAARPLFELLGARRSAVPVYGSGGFTSMSTDALVEQLSGWVDAGFPQVKMKVGTDRGTDPMRDLARVDLARQAIGDAPELFVDANGAYGLKQAVRLARAYDDLGVTWFEEPVSSDHLEALAHIRTQTPLDIAAGEYGYDLAYFAHLCRAGAVDVVQADVSRCAGITEWRRIAHLAAAHGLGISGHCAQSLHAHVAASVENLVHLEYFADHARVDRLLFEGVLDPLEGHLCPDPNTPGHGLTLRPDAQRWRVG